MLLGDDQEGGNTDNTTQTYKTTFTSLKCY